MPTSTEQVVKVRFLRLHVTKRDKYALLVDFQKLLTEGGDFAPDAPEEGQSPASSVLDIEEVRALVGYHNQKYHQDDAPEISDAEYDELVRQLHTLDTPRGHTPSANSEIHQATALVGWTELAKHSYPCLKFARVRRVDLPPLYEKGKLVPMALTRTQGLAEVSYWMFFPGNIVAYLGKRGSPGPRDLLEVLNRNPDYKGYFEQDRRVRKEILPLIDPDWNSAKNYSKMVAGHKAREMVLTMESAPDTDLPFEGGFGEMVNHALTSSSRYKVRIHLEAENYLDLPESLPRIIKSVPGVFKKVQIAGKLGDEKRTVDLLSDLTITATGRVNLLDPSSRIPMDASAFSELERLYGELKFKIRRAMSLRIEGEEQDIADEVD